MRTHDLKTHWLPTCWLLAMAVCTGCASSGSVPLSDVSFPGLHAPTTAYLGERLLEQGKGFHTDVLRVHSLNGKFVRIGGETFCRSNPGEDEFFSFNNRSVMFLNFVGGVRGFTNKVRFKQHQGEVCLSDMWSGCFGGDKSNFEYVPNSTCAHPNALQQVIEYNGRNGNTVNFTYREFRGATMASAFTQNFYMDLDVGNIINYKGARLEVDMATNQEITYRVLRNFSQQ